MRHPLRSAVAAVTALVGLVAVTPAAPVAAVTTPTDEIFISEIHYDNDGTDAGEAIEVFGPAGTDLTGWSLVLYNGNGGAVYNTTVLTEVVPDLDSTGYGVVVVEYPANGIQNGSPDGVALVDDAGAVRQFLSYEGTFAAVGGPADGLTSTDIGVEEGGTTPIGHSLQLGGEATCYGALTWSGPSTNTFGGLGPITPTPGATCEPDPGTDPDPELPAVYVSELHYDNVGTDVNEAVEVTGPAGTDLTGWSVVLYNGNGGAPYDTDVLAGTIPDLDGTGSGVVVVDYPTNGIQNGSPDGLALVAADETVVEFLSYEGTFTAVGGPADGMLSVDIGVAEGSSTAADQSLQRAADDTWSGPRCASFGTLNDPAGPTDCPLAAPELVINAALIQTAGSNDPEYVELFGTPGASLAGLSVIGIESDDQASNGNIDHRYDLGADDAIGDNGFFLLGNTAVEDELGQLVDYEIPNNALENSSITIALVETASITGTTASDVGTVLDTVGVTDGESADFFAFGAPVVGPDGTFLPAGVRRIEDGVDTDTSADWELLVFSPRDDPANVPTSAAGPVPPPVDPIELAIHAVQGPGDVSPYVGDVVTIDGVVTGVPDADGVARAFGGFYVQEPDADVDGDPNTSEGIFVFVGGTSTPALGDFVEVTGTAVEFFGLTQINDVTSTVVVSSGNPLPAPTIIEFPLTEVADLEKYEGMLVTFPQTLVISEYFNFDRFGEVVVALPADGQDRPMQPTAVYQPDDPRALELSELNARSRITIDDGLTTQNPETPVHPVNRELFSLDNAFRGGDTVSGLTGPLHFGFNQYRLLPYPDGEGYDTYQQTVAPAQPDDVGGDIQVAALNALNYFLTIDDGVNDVCGPNQTLECRGADDAGELERQRVKLLNALELLDAAVVGLNEVENRPGVEPLADLADGLNDRLGAGTYAHIVAGENSVVGTDAIKVGLIYQPDLVTPLGEPAILDTPDFLDPNGTGSDKNRAAVAQTFVENASGEVFSVVVNHLKSKGSGCGAGDDGDPRLSGSCDGTRTAAAEELAEWIATDPTGVDDDDWLIIGDLNSYDQEAPIQALQAAGYTDLIAEYQGPLAYSYVFSGQFGYLDYLLSSPSMTPQVTGATAWHINADEPDIVDYDTTFKGPYVDSLFDPTTPYRSSDHDAVLVGLSLDSFDGDLLAFPGILRPADGRLRHVVAFAVGRQFIDTEIVAISSSEADSGLSPRDQPGDIVVLDDKRALLRAETFSADGRTYTIEAQLSVPGQVRFDTAEVLVSPARGPWWRGEGRGGQGRRGEGRGGPGRS